MNQILVALHIHESWREEKYSKDKRVPHLSFYVLSHQKYQYKT